MDDLSARLSEILGSEEGMNQLRTVAAALGLNGGGDTGPSQPPAPSSSNANNFDISAIASMLNGLQNGQNMPQEPPSQPSSMPAIDPKMLGMLQTAMSAFNTNDHNVELLRALKPHFTEGRGHRVDDAIRLMQIFKMLPALGESGLFSEGGLLSMFGGGR